MKSDEVKIFLLEAFENLDLVEQHLVELESAPGNSELLQTVFRLVHTIKGNSGFLGLSRLELLCHRAENLLDRLRSKTLLLTDDIVSALLQFVDTTRAILDEVQNAGTDTAVPIDPALNSLTQQLG